MTISNGLGWSPDGLVLYYVDSPRRAVEAFDFDPVDGAITNRREVIAIEPGVGDPDGLTVDGEGCIWVCLWGGWSIRRYDPADGCLVGVVEVPVARVTSCAFGGDDLGTLFITTALPDTPDALQPHAGGVFTAFAGSAWPARAHLRRLSYLLIPIVRPADQVALEDQVDDDGRQRAHQRAGHQHRARRGSAAPGSSRDRP